MNRRALGLKAETWAAWYLRSKGYRIIEQNVHCRWGELDLVAERAGTLVFVEVKLRRSNGFGAPEEGVTDLKLERLLRAAEYYLWRRRLNHRPARVDVIAIELGQRGLWPQIRHLEGVV